MRLATKPNLKAAFTTLTLVILAVIGVTSFNPPAQAEEGRDCDDNAVIRCGTLSEAELQQKCAANEANVQTIFKEFGIISCSQLTGLVEGRVTGDNKIYVGEELKATDAVTAGRHNIPGSTPIAGGIAYKRPPSVSFVNPGGSLRALVKLDANKKFLYAVITSCGNPVTAVPIPTPPPPPPLPPKIPNFTIVKDVRVKGQNDWVQDVTAKPGDSLQYRITVKNTGETELANVHVRDQLPVGVTQTNLSLDSSTAVKAELFSQPGMNLGKLAVSQQVVVMFEVSINASTEACGTNRLNNVAIAKPENVPEKQDNATAQVCKPVVTTAVTPPQPTPAPPAAAPAPKPQPAPAVLPKTGIGDILGIFSSVSIGATLWFRFYAQKHLLRS